MYLITDKLNSSVFKPQKTNRNKGEIFSKLFQCRDEPIKVREQGRDEKHTGRLPYYENMAERKRRKDYPASVTCTHATDAV